MSAPPYVFGKYSLVQNDSKMTDTYLWHFPLVTNYKTYITIIIIIIISMDCNHPKWIQVNKHHLF